MYWRSEPKKIKDHRNNENYSMRQTGGILLLIFNLSTSWGEGSALGPGLEKSPQYPMNRRLGGTQWWFGHFGKKEISCTCRNSNHGMSSLQPSHYTDYAIPVICKITVVIILSLLWLRFFFLHIVQYFLLLFYFHFVTSAWFGAMLLI